MQDDGKYASRFSAKLSGGFCAVLPIMSRLAEAMRVSLILCTFNISKIGHGDFTLFLGVKLLPSVKKLFYVSARIPE